VFCLPLRLGCLIIIVFMAFSGFWSSYVNVEFLLTLSFFILFFNVCFIYIYIYFFFFFFFFDVLVIDRVASSMIVIYFIIVCVYCRISV